VFFDLVIISVQPIAPVHPTGLANTFTRPAGRQGKLKPTIVSAMPSFRQENFLPYIHITVLVLLQDAIAVFSESGSGWAHDCRDAGGRATQGAFAEGTSRRQWLVLAQRRNTANDRFPTRPKGGTQMSQYCVAALKKDQAILCGLRLVLEHLVTSEFAIIMLKER
jgi:hypothetical protein